MEAPRVQRSSESPADLSDVTARRELFGKLGRKASKVLIVTEGLLVYLSADEVIALAQDLEQARQFPAAQVIDLASPGLLQILQRKSATEARPVGCDIEFGPKEGPLFFVPHGWKPIAVQTLLKSAARLKRLSFWMRILAILPESTGKQGSRPWGGVCLLARD